MSRGFGSDPEVQRTLIRAVTAVVVFVLAAGIVMVLLGRDEQITRIGLLVSQGFVAVLNFWMINKSALTTNSRVDSVREELTERREK